MIFSRSMIPTFFHALCRALKALVSPGDLLVADEQVQKARAARCRNCPHFVGKSGQCDLCMCVVSLKVLMAGEICPDSPPRWRAQTSYSTGLFPT